MNTKGYTGPWFSPKEITDIINGKKNNYYYEPTQPRKKQITVKTTQNKLRQIELNKLNKVEQNQLKRYPQFGEKIIKYIPSKEGGRSTKLYSRVYVDICLTITADKRLRNINAEIADAILQATLRPAEIDKLAKNKLGNQAYSNLKKSKYYNDFCKAIYNKQRRLKNATLKAKEKYINTYVTPLQKNIDSLNKKNELLRNIVFDNNITAEVKIAITKFATTHDYSQTRDYTENLLNKQLY